MFRKNHIGSYIVMIASLFLIALFSNGCKKSSDIPMDDVILDLSQTQWSLQYSSSQGEIEVYLRGTGASDILLDSIQMRGDNSSATPIAPSFVQNNGDHVVARFPKNQVLGLLDSQDVGTTHTIAVTYYTVANQERKEIRAQVTVTDQNDDEGGNSNTTGFTLEIDPYEWSLNFVNSQGTVEAFIKGDGIENIDLESFRMKGDNTGVEAIAALSATLQGDHVHARFAKNQLIALLLDPQEGSTHTITVLFENNETDTIVELNDEITIEEDEDNSGIEPSELSLEIDPDEWSLNFDKSSGIVTAFITGEGIEHIDLESILMKGDNESAEPLLSDSTDLNGDHVRARFPKNQVLGLLLDPQEGSVHTITIIFTDTEIGEQLELTAQIAIEEDDDDDDGGTNPKPTDLTLEIVPSQWNMNYAGSSGVVKIFISGDDIDQIDLDQIEMSGDNASAGGLEALSASLQGNHVQAQFPKNQVLDLLAEPGPGTSHTITVTIEVSGSEVQLTADISIVGNN